MKWTEKETLPFVEIYQEYECLWNKACHEHKDRNKRKLIEEEIVKEIQYLSATHTTKTPDQQSLIDQQRGQIIN